MATMEVNHNTYVQGSFHGPYTINANETSRSITAPHGLGFMPTAVHVQAYGDTGAMTIVTSMTSWDATNVTFLVRNLAGLSEIIYFSVIAL